jgi:hypothetical protein
VPRIHLGVEDAVELAELLQFVQDWLAADEAAAALANGIPKSDHW